MLQNASYMFVFKKETKQNDFENLRKKFHPAEVEPETFDV